jgi:glycosyltransferase involved in cell wall biosynthesis
MISKACVVGIYQRKLEEMARLPDVELTVIVPPSWRDPSGDVPLERAHVEGYKLLVEPIRFNGDFHLYHFPTLARRLDDICPDIVHIDEEPYNFAAWQALWLSRRMKARTLFFSWQNILRRYPSPFSIGEAYVLRNTDYGIAGTESAAEVWRAKGYRKPLAVIPQFGVDPVIFALRERHSEAGNFCVGYIGRLVPEKGIDLLIKALSKIADPWRLDIIGQGQERASLERLVHKLNLADRITFVGQIPSVRIPDFYHQLDAIVIPSRTKPSWKEQFGRVIIEAMASGVPVIGSDSGAIPDIIGNAGLIFPENDEAALTERLQSLMNDSRLRGELAVQGRARAVEHFTHAQVAAETVEVYKKLNTLQNTD